jgi:hypothetical protein
LSVEILIQKKGNKSNAHISTAVGGVNERRKMKCAKPRLMQRPRTLRSVDSFSGKYSIAQA